MPRKGENIFKRKDGRWEARYIHHYENGVAKYRYLYGATYMEAKQKRIAELNGAYCHKKKEKAMLCCSFEQLANEWLGSVQNTVKEATYARYVRIVKRYLFPSLAATPLAEISATRINCLTANYLTMGAYRQSPLSSKTVLDIVGVFALIAKFGNEKGNCKINIAAIKRPKATKKTIEILDRPALKKFEDVLLRLNDPLCPGLLLALFSGVRIGELCGIKWGDIDFEHKAITVKRTVERIANTDEVTQSKTKVILSTPKTESSYRIIPMQSFLVEILRRHKKSDPCYLLTGTPKFTEPHQYYVRYKQFLKKHGLGNYTFHCLRHTFATRCVEAGVDVKSLSEILGHSNVSTTLSLYIHPSLEQKRTQMEKISPTVHL